MSDPVNEALDQCGRCLSFEPCNCGFGDPKPTPDDTAAPDHYKARYFAIGVQAGAEMIDWIVAMRGKQFAIDAMIFEIQTKANRLGLGARTDHIVEDCFKIRQACRVVERLKEES